MCVYEILCLKMGRQEILRINIGLIVRKQSHLYPILHPLIGSVLHAPLNSTLKKKKNVMGN